MTTVINGTDPIEVLNVLLTASDRLADLLGDNWREDAGTVALSIELRELAEKVRPVPMDRDEFTNKEQDA